MLFPYVYIDSLVCLKSSSSICLFFQVTIGPCLESVVKELGVEGLKRTPKIFDLSKIRAKKFRDFSTMLM